MKAIDIAYSLTEANYNSVENQIIMQSKSSNRYYDVVLVVNKLTQTDNN